MTTRALRAVWVLTGVTIRRLLREGLVLRSLVWPGLLAAFTLTATFAVVAMARTEPVVAVAADTPPAVLAALGEADLALLPHPDPRAAVVAGDAPVGTDGRTLWTAAGSPHALRAEVAVREAIGAPWSPARPARGVSEPPPPPAELPKLPPDAAARVLALLFMLYGLVFGLGGVARDRDGGILDAELSLPVPRWTTGLARWLGSTIVLAVFLTLSVALFAAVMPIGSPWPAIVHGIAAVEVAVAVGMAVVGHAGLKQGFSGPFGVGMTVMTATASLGLRYDVPWLPVASLFAQGDGTVAILLGAVAGVGGSLVYARRSGGPP
jgi:hypothetical protein